MGRTVGKKSRGPSTTIPISLRLSPRTYFGLTLLARKRHCTLTAAVELAVTRAIADEVDGLVERRGKETVNILDQTWDPDEADRVVKLAMMYPALLHYEQDKLWKAIREEPTFWESKDQPNFKAIRDRWPALKAHYLGDTE